MLRSNPIKIGQLVTAFQVKARHAALVPTSSLLMSQSTLDAMDDFELWESYPSESSKGNCLTFVSLSYALLVDRLPQHLAEGRLVRLQEVFLRYLEKQIISFRYLTYICLLLLMFRAGKSYAACLKKFWKHPWMQMEIWI